MTSASISDFRYVGSIDLATETREFLRANVILLPLSNNFHMWHFPLEECFKAVYGEAGSRRFWELECSEPVGLSRFVNILTYTVEPADFNNLGRPDLEKASRTLALRGALVAAFQASPENRSFFSGDLSSLEAARAGSQLDDRVKVHMRPTAEWLLQTPKRRHLVPESLRAFLMSNSAATDSPAAAPIAKAAAKRRPGPSPVTRDATIADMRDLIKRNEMTVDELTNGKEEPLARRFGVSRDTFRQARDVVLKSVADGTPTNSDPK